MVAHLVATFCWAVVEDPLTASLAEAPFRALGSALFAPCLALVYAGVGGVWLVLLGELLRWPRRRALAAVLSATTPPIFAAVAVVIGWGTGSLASIPAAGDVLTYLVAAPIAFALAAVPVLGSYAGGGRQ